MNKEPDFISYLVLPSGEDRAYTLSAGGEERKKSTRKFLTDLKRQLLKGYNSEARKKARIVIRDIQDVQPFIRWDSGHSEYQLSWSRGSEVLGYQYHRDRLYLEDVADAGYRAWCKAV
jgi:hypothetical protein